MARRGAGAAALGADGGQLASAQQTQGLTEAEGQAVPLAAWGGGHGRWDPQEGAPTCTPPAPAPRGGPPSIPPGPQVSSYCWPRPTSPARALGNRPGYTQLSRGPPLLTPSGAQEKPRSLPPLSIPADPRRPRQVLVSREAPMLLASLRWNRPPNPDPCTRPARPP